MKSRFLGLILVIALAAPAAARPAIVVPHRTTSWVRLWQGFLGFFTGFRLFDAMDASGHTLPPPTCTTSYSGQ